MISALQDTDQLKKVSDQNYSLRFVQNQEELKQVLRLRFEVFNLELNEGLKESFTTGLDQDQFDEVCHHLIVVHQNTNKVVGTYRMQAWESASQGLGFYSANEFDFRGFPLEILKNSVELGRVCIDRAHRNMTVLNMLMRGVAFYLWANKKENLFGCTSITSQDPMVASNAFGYLRNSGYMHKEIFLNAKPSYSCQILDENMNKAFYDLPMLFKIYIRLGAKIISQPAIDQEFKTIDFLMTLNVHDLNPLMYRFFFDFLKS